MLSTNLIHNNLNIAILTTGGTIEGVEYCYTQNAPKSSPITIAQHLQKINLHLI